MLTDAKAISKYSMPRKQYVCLPSPVENSLNAFLQPGAVSLLAGLYQLQKLPVQ